MIAVLQAKKEGREIECRYLIEDAQNTGRWLDCFHRQPNFQEWDYRIKPEPPKPREWWTTTSDDGMPCKWCGFFKTPAEVSESALQAHGTNPLIHLREVLPES